MACALAHATNEGARLRSNEMKKVLIDTDPGTDDALALMMALNSPDLDVLGLTTVGGNARLAHTTRNALRLMDHLGRPDMPVSRGASRPLRGNFSYGYHFHGPGGLTVRLPAGESKPVSTRAPEYIAKVAEQNQGELVLIALGPLTNIARVILGEPRLPGWLREIVVMGGAIEVPGNVTPHAEFNIWNDPKAADIVLSSGVPVKLIGLDVTSQAYVSRGESRWIGGESASARLASRIIANWFKSHPHEDRYHLHDPLAVAAAIRPDLLTFRRATVQVDPGDSDPRGRTSASYGDGPVSVAAAADINRAMAMIRRLIEGETL